MSNDFTSDLIKEINFVRTNPKQYAEKLLSNEKYYENSILRFPGITAIQTHEGFKALKEAADVLYNLKPLQPLENNILLKDVSFDILSKNKSGVGNVIDIDEILNKHGQLVGIYANSIDFGSASAELVVLHLLADDGDSSRGNRENILNNKFKLIGISHGQHKTYKYVTTICFARHFFDKNVQIDTLSEDNYEIQPTKPLKKSNEKFKDANTKETTMTIQHGGSKNEEIYYEDKKETREINNQKSNRSNKKVTIQEIQEEVLEESIKNPKLFSNMSIPKINNSNSKQKSVSKNEDDFYLPEGVLKIELREKEIVENGIKRIIVRETKYLEDGTKLTEIYKKDY